MPDLHRALLCLDAKGDARILATDSACIAGDIDAIGTTCADDIGIVSSRKVGPGLSLWTGTIAMVNCSAPDMPEDWQPDFTGEVRSVVNMLEALELFQMHPPEPEFPEDDRESPGV
jgi:hypothetical protein